MGPIVVFTPTLAPGGLDVNYASCLRQTLHPSIVWVVADELLEARTAVWKELGSQKDLLGVEVFKVEGKYDRNLASSYNVALGMAREWEAILFVSLQDYFWAPEDGVQKFLEAALRWPNTLLTGHASIADNPGPEAVKNPQGAFTIFEKPYNDRPEESWWWHEVRGEGETGWYASNPIEWEMNWAAVPHDIIMSGIEFDSELDRGIACENQDFALTCREKLGTRFAADASNHAIGLPHKLYFPEQDRANIEALAPNREYMEQKWGIPAVT